jgi:hypothetical protein
MEATLPSTTRASRELEGALLLSSSEEAPTSRTGSWSLRLCRLREATPPSTTCASRELDSALILVRRGPRRMDATKRWSSFHP